MAQVFDILLPPWVVILIYCYSSSDKVWREGSIIVFSSRVVNCSLCDWFFLAIENLMKLLLNVVNRHINQHRYGLYVETLPVILLERSNLFFMPLELFKFLINEQANCIDTNLHLLCNLVLWNIVQDLLLELCQLL